MQEDVRRILKVAAPFAGVALGWYLFLPNFRYMQLSGGDYKSQFLINLEQLRTISSRVQYSLTTPQVVKDWKSCRWEAGKAIWDLPIEKRVQLSFEQWLIDKCGPAPAED